MTGLIELLPTRCAICHTHANASDLYPANLDPGAFSPATFSARRLPDRIHYRMVRCDGCGLVRSDPVADPGVLTQLYRLSGFSYADEVPNLRRSYGDCLARLAQFGAKKGSLLEIGCGNGFFLEEALKQGYGSVKGVEPSASSVDSASPGVRSQVVCDVMRPGLFGPEQFDVICAFQVLDHVPSPDALLDECRNLLRPGGLFLCVCHNVEALSARLLKDRSPIVDVEHTYLYSPATLSRLFASRGFHVERVGPLLNGYSLRYLAHLAPLPRVLKRVSLALLENRYLGGIRVALPLGNLCLIARKPPEEEVGLGYPQP